MLRAWLATLLDLATRNSRQSPLSQRMHWVLEVYFGGVIKVNHCIYNFVATSQEEWSASKVVGEPAPWRCGALYIIILLCGMAELFCSVVLCSADGRCSIYTEESYRTSDTSTLYGSLFNASPSIYEITKKKHAYYPLLNGQFCRTVYKQVPGPYLMSSSHHPWQYPLASRSV